MWLAVRVKRRSSESKCVALEAAENAVFADLLEKLKEIKLKKVKITTRFKDVENKTENTSKREQ